MRTDCNDGGIQNIAYLRELAAFSGHEAPGPGELAYNDVVRMAMSPPAHVRAPIYATELTPKIPIGLTSIGRRHWHSI